VSDFTINLGLRKFPPFITTVHDSGKKFEDLYLVYSGKVSITIGTGHPVLILPECSHFGDFQIFFELKSLFNYRTHHQHDPRKSATENEKLANETTLMCINSKVFLNICEMHPKTAKNLKLRSLERRHEIMKRVAMTVR